MINSTQLTKEQILVAASLEDIIVVSSDESYDSGINMAELAVEDPACFHNDCENVKVREGAEEDDIVIEIVDNTCDASEQGEKPSQQTQTCQGRWRRKRKANVWSRHVLQAVAKVGGALRPYEQKPFDDP